jgi:hypothetical protein
MQGRLMLHDMRPEYIPADAALFSTEGGSINPTMDEWTALHNELNGKPGAHQEVQLTEGNSWARFLRTIRTHESRAWN